MSSFENSAAVGRQAHVLDAGRLRVEFTRRGDRWHHSIGYLQDNDFHPVLESAEGRPDDVWPASPPCQELQFATHDNRSVALLVGQTARCHWSLSVEANPAESQVRFDVACRVPSQESLGTLSSVYRSLAGSPAKLGGEAVAGTNDASKAVWVWAEQLTMQAESGSSLWPDAAGGVVIESDPQAFEFPATFRWRYVVAARAAIKPNLAAKAAITTP